ncbi:MAG: hypothetical protein R3B45_14850 [Bdellovibrionota bacterium]
MVKGSDYYNEVGLNCEVVSGRKLLSTIFLQFDYKGEKMIGRILINACSLLLFASCYVDGNGDRRASRGGMVGDTPHKSEAPNVHNRNECHFTIDKGCFEGHVSPAMELTVENEVFFDANDLAARFAEAITIESDEIDTEEALVLGEDYEVKLVTPFNNDDFLKGFVVFVKGEQTSFSQLRAKGNFFIDDLPQGEYKLRVQRPIDFLVRYLKKEGEEVQKTDKYFCATLYQDHPLEIYPNEKAESAVFDQFKLYVKNVECTNPHAGGTILRI